MIVLLISIRKKKEREEKEIKWNKKEIKETNSKIFGFQQKIKVLRSQKLQQQQSKQRNKQEIPKSFRKLIIKLV